MTIQVNATQRKAAIDAMLSPGTSANGPDSGTLIIYSGTEPATADAALSGNTVLVTETLAADAFPAASGAAGATATSALASTPISAVASATGTATFFRILASGGGCVLQGTVTATGGGGDMTIDNTAVSSGVTVQITSLSMTWPA